MPHPRAGLAVSDQVVAGAFVLMVLGIGGNVVAVRSVSSSGDIDPLWAGASRFIIAALLFAAVAAVIRSPLPRGRALFGATAYGALSIGGFFAFAYWGLQEAPAGPAAVVLATGPLLTFLFAIAHGQERFRWDGLAGAALVVAGTAVVFSAGASQGVPIPSLLAILASSACAAEGAVLVKLLPAVRPVQRNAIGMGVGAITLLALMPLFGESFELPSRASTWTAQIYLILIGTVGVFSIYLFLLNRWTASAVSYEFVLGPVAAIVLANWLLDEPITGRFLAGAVLVLAGVYLGAIRPRRIAEVRRVEPAS
ncbi:MAG: EamA family transporter [Sporichthyaceae bacterium]|nr:EamA family transporter [Sporichthyaceae bacterium]